MCRDSQPVHHPAGVCCVRGKQLRRDQDPQERGADHPAVLHQGGGQGHPRQRRQGGPQQLQLPVDRDPVRGGEHRGEDGRDGGELPHRDPRCPLHNQSKHHTQGVKTI